MKLGEEMRGKKMRGVEKSCKKTKTLKMREETKKETIEKRR